MNFLKSIKTKLSKTSKNFSSNLSDIFANSNQVDEILQQLEELLITSDFGVNLSGKVIDNLRENKLKKLTADEVKNLLIKQFQKQIEDKIKDKEVKISEKEKVTVIMLFGVNGSGKTTTIAKLSNLLKQNNKKVLLAACDCFRAGATAQLVSWADKLNIDIFAEKEGSDPASVAYKAYSKAIDENYDYLIVDTSGRLQNNQNLMQELLKINNVIKKINAKAPHYNLLVLDGTNGQNINSQVEHFGKIIPISGFIITKLDGTAKAGAVIGAIDKFQIPIFYLCFGESEFDIKQFNLLEFLEGILDL